LILKKERERKEGGSRKRLAYIQKMSNAKGVKFYLGPSSQMKPKITDCSASSNKALLKPFVPHTRRTSLVSHSQHTKNVAFIVDGSYQHQKQDTGEIKKVNPLMIYRRVNITNKPSTTPAPATRLSESMSLTIKLPIDVTFEVNVLKYGSLDDLRFAIRMKSGIPIFMQRLVVAGKDISDRTNLFHYGSGSNIGPMTAIYVAPTGCVKPLAGIYIEEQSTELPYGMLHIWRNFNNSLTTIRVDYTKPTMHMLQAICDEFGLSASLPDGSGMQTVLYKNKPIPWLAEGKLEDFAHLEGDKRSMNVVLLI
jgi:hypothetical protein